MKWFHAVAASIAAAFVCSGAASADDTARPSGMEIAATAPQPHTALSLLHTARHRPLLFRGDSALEQERTSHVKYRIETWFPSLLDGRVFVKVGDRSAHRVYQLRESPDGEPRAYEKWSLEMSFYPDGTRDVVLTPEVAWELEYADGQGGMPTLQPGGPRLYRIYEDGTVAGRGLSAHVTSHVQVYDDPVRLMLAASWDPVLLLDHMQTHCESSGLEDCDVVEQDGRIAAINSTFPYNEGMGITLERRVSVSEWLRGAELELPVVVDCETIPSVSLPDLHTLTRFTMVGRGEGANR